MDYWADDPSGEKMMRRPPSSENVPIYGMIHLAGESPVYRALSELRVIRENGMDGAILENYHGTRRDLNAVLDWLLMEGLDMDLGINVLPNEYHVSLPLAHRYNASFVQLDHVAGRYKEGALNVGRYSSYRESYPDVFVMGGVWPKYYTPVPGSDLSADIEAGMQRADAIVVTGEGTGKATPVEKIRQFRESTGDFPLVVGAGVTPENAYDALAIADGAIVGTSLKIGGDTAAPVDSYRVRDLMDVVSQVREEKNRSALQESYNSPL